MPDARLEAAIANWAPRYVEDGIPVGDFQEVTGSLDSWDDWCRAWSDRGAVHEQLGEEALAEGHRKSAGYHFMTAAACYHFGKFLFVHEPGQLRVAHDRAVAVHRKAHPLVDPPIERCEIPYEGAMLFGNLRMPTGIDRPPVVVMMPGLDSTKEELEYYGQWFVDRGMATLAIDGPGQGEAEFDLPIEPRYERPVGAAIDYLESRGDVDAGRVGAWGVSLGGYYVVRAAAFEGRIRAAVSLSGPVRFVSEWDVIPPISRLAFQVRSHSATEQDARDAAEKLDLTDVLHRVTCPLYVIGGDRDRLIPPEAAREIAAGVSGPVVLDIVRDGNHVVNNKAYRYRPATADWMAQQLGAMGG